MEPQTQFEELTVKVGKLAQQTGFKNHSQAQSLNNSNRSVLTLEEKDNIHHIIWDLISERIVTPGLDPRNQNWPLLRLTDFGKIIVSDSSSKYYDPDGYVSRLRTLIPNIDSVIVQYMSEALKCFRQRMFFSASVMCGAAAEKALLLLLSSLATYESNLKEKKDLEGLLERPNLPKILKSIQSKVDQLINEKKLPYTVHQGSSLHLLSLFEMIRVHRNEAVHPKSGRVTKEKIFLSIQTMPEALQVLSGLTNWFDSRKTQG